VPGSVSSTEITAGDHSEGMKDTILKVAIPKVFFGRPWMTCRLAVIESLTSCMEDYYQLRSFDSLPIGLTFEREAHLYI
jgi:hypothetical protein